MRNRVSSTVLMTLATLLVFAAPIGAGKSKDAENLEAVNQRWRGARCRTRQVIQIKKGQDREGWAKSKWMEWGEEDNPNKKRGVRMWVSDADSVRRALTDRLLPPGTELVVKGWQLDEDSPVLELEFVSLPGSAKVVYWVTWGRAGAKHLPELERWTRFELLEIISAPSEQLTQVDAEAVESTPNRQPAPPRESSTPSIASAPTTLNVIAVDVRPDQVRPGSEIEQVITYEIGGAPPGPGFEVLERREIFKGEQRLAGTDERIRRSNGTHSSSQSLRLPTQLESGFYSLRVTVTTAGIEAAGSAFFEVR